MNVIKNCPVMTEDVMIAEKIFGADMLSLKGKSARCKTTPVREDIIEIPEELIAAHRDVDLYALTICMLRLQLIKRSDSGVGSQSRTAHTTNTTVYWTWYCDCTTVQLFISKQYIATESSAQ
jgi:hypothetical protein